MSKHKLNNFAFYQKLNNVEDLHIYEKKEVRCGFSIYLTPALKLYSTTQSHQLAFKIVFIHEYHRLWVQDPFQCVELLEEIQNQTKCWRKKNAGTVQLVSGRVYLASSCGLPHLWGISIHPLFSATPTTKKTIGIHQNDKKRIKMEWGYFDALNLRSLDEVNSSRLWATLLPALGAALALRSDTLETFLPTTTFWFLFCFKMNIWINLVFRGATGGSKEQTIRQTLSNATLD